jgi:hypothetical protein
MSSRAYWLMLIAMFVLAGLVGTELLTNVREHTRVEGCERLIGWMKAMNWPPGAYPDIALPLSLQKLAADARFDAVILQDGRVFVVVKTALTWQDNWDGVLFGSASLRADDFTKDNYGRQEIRFLPMEHFVSRQINDHYCRIAFDLG